MSRRWQEVALKVGVFWILIPVSVAAVGYFVVGWLTTKDKPAKATRVAQPITQPTREASAKDEKWAMPDPPQIDISVEKVEEEEEPPKPEEEAKPVEIEVPEGEEVDEAGVGGFVKPPPPGGGESGTSTPPSAEGDGGERAI